MLQEAAAGKGFGLMKREAIRRSTAGYVGLVNQGMTCYQNSVLYVEIADTGQWSRANS